MTTFDEHERTRWAGRAAAYERAFAPLCAHPINALLDAAGIGPTGAGTTRIEPAGIGTTGIGTTAIEPARIGVGFRVHDAGTGTGAVAARAAARGAVVTAADAEPSMLELAGRRVPAAVLCQAVLPDLPFADGYFDAAVANFVLNHVGDPAAAVAELRRVVRPGGRIAVTIWPVPAPPAQQLWGQVFDAAQAERPAVMPRLDADKDFGRTPEGLSGLLRDAELTDVTCEALAWTHHTDPDDWWSGPANGVATAGMVMEHQPATAIPRIRAAFDELTAPYRDDDGRLALPTAALLASATVSGR